MYYKDCHSVYGLCIFQGTGKVDLRQGFYHVSLYEFCSKCFSIQKKLSQTNLDLDLFFFGSLAQCHDDFQNHLNYVVQIPIRRLRLILLTASTAIVLKINILYG
jgi:hypothetical protein